MCTFLKKALLKKSKAFSILVDWNTRYVAYSVLSGNGQVIMLVFTLLNIWLLKTGVVELQSMITHDSTLRVRPLLPVRRPAEYDAGSIVLRILFIINLLHKGLNQFLYNVAMLFLGQWIVLKDMSLNCRQYCDYPCRQVFKTH